MVGKIAAIASEVAIPEVGAIYNCKGLPGNIREVGAARVIFSLSPACTHPGVGELEALIDGGMQTHLFTRPNWTTTVINATNEFRKV